MTSAVVVKPFPLAEEFKKKTGITARDVQALREWLDTQPHLPGALITDLDLVLTYHCCEKSSSVTKQVLDLHYTLKTLFAIFKNRTVSPKTLHDLTIYLPLPLEARTHDGNAVFYTRLLNSDTKNFVFEDGVRVVLMSLELWQLEEGTWPGFSIVIDLAQVSLGHLARLDLQTVQHFLYYLQEAMLVRLKGLHFLNAPSFMDRLMMIIRPFMKKQLLEMLVIHQIGSKTIDKYLPIEGLPKEAGGQYLGIEEARDKLIERFKLNGEFFAEDAKKRVTENLRPGKPKTITDIFGSVEGSFKKLDID